MAAVQPLGPAEPNTVVYCDPCLGLVPFVIPEPRDFWMGRAIVLAVALMLLGILLGLVLRT